MATETIIRGENRLLTRTLRLNDGVTALPVASLALAKVTLLQGGKEKLAFTLGTHAQLRAGGSADEIVFELTSATTLALKAGLPITLRWELRVADADFTAEPGLFIDIQDETPWSLAP